MLGLWGVRYQVKDVERSISFYTRTLGFHLDRQPGGFRNEMEAGPGGRQIQVEDPDGNPIELFEPAGR